MGYNLPDSYLGIPLSIFTINITLGNKNINNYTINCYVYIIVDHTQLKSFQISQVTLNFFAGNLCNWSAILNVPYSII